MSRNMELALTLKARDDMSRTVGRALQTIGQESQRAERAVVGLSRESQRMASARETLGIRAERTIQREIAQTEAAYQRLSRSGTLSAREQVRAFDAMRDKVGKLRQEMHGVERQQSKLISGAKGLAAVAAGVAVGARVLSGPVKQTMGYERRLAMMANTAYAERNLSGRKQGMVELDKTINTAVRHGGGTREEAADTLDNLIASGAMDIKTASSLLPTLQKMATGTGADPKELGNIAIRAMQTMGIKPQEVPVLLDQAIMAGQKGGFELKDMAKWLPQQMAAAKLSGISGMPGMAKLLAANQAAVITAGSKDEAGNNLVNLLTKINSQDTARDAAKISATTFREKRKGEQGIDLPATLARGREKGMDSLDSFVGLTEKVIGGDKRYQTIQDKLKRTDNKDERRALLESQGDILQGSAIGKLIQDRQALMALVAIMNNRKYMQDIETALPNAKGTGQANYQLIADTPAFKAEQLANERAIATQKAMEGLNGALGDAASKLVEYAQEYPGLTAALVAAGTATAALAAAAAAAAIPLALIGKGGMPGLPGGGGGATIARNAGKGWLGRLGLAGLVGGTLFSMVPDTNEKQGREDVKKGDWWNASFNLPAPALFAAVREQLFPAQPIKRNAPDPGAPIPQAGVNAPAPAPPLALLQSVMDSSTRFNLAADKIQQASQQPIPLHVTVDVQNGNIVAAVNQANKLEWRRN
ncbi:tail tape measure protein [Aquitalea palustris]|uniref:Tail tape measure protein n=1 Tax=Aquitalea palustris TaxID=2480983 RepID=A0A454JKN4_9NEIS|nr:phage tail tape measure protein [Aquitalea palustris]RMC99881.1 tail tape measure protein [Aquitalea palustris]